MKFSTDAFGFSRGSVQFSLHTHGSKLVLKVADDGRRVAAFEKNPRNEHFQSLSLSLAARGVDCAGGERLKL